MIKEWLTALSLLSPVMVDAPRTNINEKLLWIVDDSASMTPEQALAEFAAGKAQGPQKAALNLGLINHPVYALIPLKNQQDEATYILDCAYPLIDYIDVYQLQNDVLTQIGAGGDRRPFVNRSEPHRTPNFRLQLAPHEQSYVLLKIWGTSSIQLPLFLYTAHAYSEHSGNENLGFGLFYGHLDRGTGLNPNPHLVTTRLYIPDESGVYGLWNTGTALLITEGMMLYQLSIFLDENIYGIE